MKSAYIVRGKLDESGVLQVAERFPLPAGDVEVIVHPIAAPSDAKHSLWDVVYSSPFAQPADGLMAELNSLRDEWEH